MSQLDEVKLLLAEVTLKFILRVIITRSIEHLKD